MYCKHCGKEIDNDSSFCKHCGKKLCSPFVSSDAVGYRVVKTILSDTKWFVYSIWFVVNLCCLFGLKDGNEYYHLYPRLSYEHNAFSLRYYQFTDFMVYAVLVPATLFLGYHYFKLHTKIISRFLWGVWFFMHFMLYCISDFVRADFFYPFTLTSLSMNELVVIDPLFDYHAYDLLELVVYTMLIPIGYWGYLYYREIKSTKEIK